ncbi:hypothetical protein [Kitasatospora kifunensis]|uniref:Uncharacterized protein n=1 Tax=Kitasatospora kifunensis TaxID=58351 RepID=A0A7W7QYN7_KITKI|nr:hypothetical protein [Kitasatospora kifunensis]MBB4922237.1 hypothetical protein [Kitasatospora kifunensis]
MTTETWPEGVIARYMTMVGLALADPNITVDLINDGGEAICRGCGKDWPNPNYPFTVRQWAESHAETCRALPDPNGAQR